MNIIDTFEKFAILSTHLKNLLRILNSPLEMISGRDLNNISQMMPHI